MTPTDLPDWSNVRDVAEWAIALRDAGESGTVTAFDDEIQDREDLAAEVARIDGKRGTLWLGEPPFDNVERAAELLLEYRSGGATPDAERLFLRAVKHPRAVLDAANG